MRWWGELCCWASPDDKNWCQTPSQTRFGNDSGMLAGQQSVLVDTKQSRITSLPTQMVINFRYRLCFSVLSFSRATYGTSFTLTENLKNSCSVWRHRLHRVSVSVSAQDSIMLIGKALPRLSAVPPGLPSKQCQCLSGWTQIVPDLGGWNVGRFLSPLLFFRRLMMFWPVHVQKVIQASEHFCPA